MSRLRNSQPTIPLCRAVNQLIVNELIALFN